MTEEEKTVSQDAVKKVEDELLAKKKAAEDKARAEAAKLAEDAEKRGKENAMKEFEAAQEKKRLQEELEAVKSRAAALEEQTKKAMEESAKRFQEEIEKLKSERKGISRNDSPFNPTPEAAKDAVADLMRDPAKKAEVDRASRQAFAKAYGLGGLAD